MIIMLFMILYHQFDLPAVQRYGLAHSPRLHENFPGVITPYLERGRMPPGIISDTAMMLSEKCGLSAEDYV